MAHRSCAADDPHRVPDDLFRARLDNMIDMRHPLVRVSHVTPWDALIAAVGHSLPEVPEGPGRRPLPARLIIGLLYLKHAYYLSHEALCSRWLENPYFQYFCGEVVWRRTSWLVGLFEQAHSNPVRRHPQLTPYTRFALARDEAAKHHRQQHCQYPFDKAMCTTYRNPVWLIPAAPGQ